MDGDQTRREGSCQKRKGGFWEPRKKLRGAKPATGRRGRVGGAAPQGKSCQDPKPDLACHIMDCLGFGLCMS